MIKCVLVAMLSFLGILTGCTATCKNMPVDDSNIGIQEERGQLVVSNSETKQHIDPCPTFELNSISCNREESLEVHRSADKKIEAINEQASEGGEE
ncbi:hypothetical protein [Teredinibacter turnerae]|uniref:hypothetical protein n=1 Tax=Teredinibacter turnerae TaxID=2426 RepID=UPI00035C7F3A|nr:hypothetical protein [Teredinibacter turnerae]